MGNISNGMNDKQNKKLIIFIILCIFAVFTLIRGVLVPTRPKLRASSEPEPVSLNKTVNFIEEGLSLRRNTAKSNYVNWGRNPFTMGAVIKVGAEDTLEGIIWDEKSPLALINGRTIRIGDKLGSDKVIDIQKNKVVLSDGIRERELKLQ